MTGTVDWMPAFTVIEAERTTHVRVSAKGGHRREETCEGADLWQRIGTAIPREGGGFILHLTAIPLRGQVVIRPPLDGETRDPVLG